jgi:type IV secretion system T-DNA border endonuclease VirD1
VDVRIGRVGVEGGVIVPPRADRTISVRLTEAELAELDAQIDGLGLNRNRALRIAARRIGGFLEVDCETVEALA